MCGIAGAIGSRDGSLVKRMTETMHHRGPDSHGYFSGADIDLGVQRLSIVDLISGDQPIYDETRSKAIVCNGEIYNHLELRKELLEKGHNFRTNSDTEVIVHLYEEYGVECVSRLNGMFAFAIADGDKLFVARDRMGIKPLYYSYIQKSGLFIFASEIKALLQCPELPATIDEEALTDTWVLGYPLGDKTYLKGIQCLRPGHYLCVSSTKQGMQIKDSEYDRLRIDPDDSLDYQKSENELYALLKKSIRGHLQGDVKIGLALSGGIDSSTLAFLMKENLNETFPSFTIADDKSNPDFSYAENIAQSIQSNHASHLPGFEYYFDSLPSFVLSSEQSQLRLVPFFLLSREIGKYIKVCLIGEGADELFGGYTRFLNPAIYISHLRHRFELAKRRGLPHSKDMELMVDCFLAVTTAEDQLKMVFLAELQEQLTRGHLEFIDKLSMASGVETRVPFLSNEVIDFANMLPLNFKINDGVGKYILKKMAARSFGEAVISHASREKLGFHAAGKKFLDHFFNWCQINLPDKYASEHEYAPFFYNYRLEPSISKGSLLMFDLFRYVFIKHRGVISRDFTMNDFLRTNLKLGYK